MISDATLIFIVIAIPTAIVYGLLALMVHEVFKDDGKMGGAKNWNP